MSLQIKVIFLFTLVAVVLSALPNINKCQLKDSKCLKSSVQELVPVLVAGIPEVDTEVLDPMHVDFINVDLAGLKLTIRNVQIKGLRDSIIDKLSVDMAKKQMKLIFHSDFILKGKYNASGRLLILPISGDGDAVVKLKNCQLTVDILFDITKSKNGNDVIDLKSYKFNYDVRDNTHFHLSNLFNGNKELSDAMHTFMNTNWKVVTEEFGLPVFEQPIDKLYNSIKAYLKSQSLEDIAIL